MDVREIAENAARKAMDENHIGWDDWYPDVIVSAILAALKEAGYVVTELEPALEQVWLQNLCGFIDGKFIPVDDKWQEIWKQRVRALAAAQEQEGE